ncbi:TPA: hypothetical protein ACPYY2_004841, partial [Escherichia coli]
MRRSVYAYTSSACAPETDLQQLVATLVPDEQRISFWP